MDSYKKTLILNIIALLLLINKVPALEHESIVGGKYASPGTFTYHAVLNFTRGNICGGAVIDESFVLTAAHCVLNIHDQPERGPLLVSAGITDLGASSENVRLVTAVYVSKQFTFAQGTGDIAVLKVNKPFDLGDGAKVKKLALPTQATYFGEKGVVSGFGLQVYQSKPTSFIDSETADNLGRDGKLKFLRVNILESQQCQKFYEKSFLPFFPIKKKTHDISRTFICSRSDEVDERSGTCKGDSGGPLVVKDDVLVGILSYSSTGCDEKAEPSVYVRVHSYLKDIQNAKKDIISGIRKFEFDIEAYKRNENLDYLKDIY